MHNDKKEEKILNDLEKGYDQIADKFSGTRKYLWRDFEFIVDYVKNKDKILDFGCGNGRLFEMLKSKDLEYIGVDVSQKLIDIAKTAYPDYQEKFQKISSSSILPFSNDFFNSIFSIAVFHHFPKKHSREMVKEFYRITKPGGVVVVSVWNLWQGKHLRRFLNFKNILGKIFQIGKYRGLGVKDVLIPFKNNQGLVFDRFHHAFTERELVEIFKNAGFAIEKSFLLNNKNIIIVARKC